jgi:hypothetical protein
VMKEILMEDMKFLMVTNSWPRLPKLTFNLILSTQIPYLSDISWSNIRVSWRNAPTMTCQDPIRIKVMDLDLCRHRDPASRSTTAESIINSFGLQEQPTIRLFPWSTTTTKNNSSKDQ